MEYRPKMSRRMLGTLAAFVCASGTLAALPQAGIQVSRRPAAAPASTGALDWVVSGNPEFFDTEFQTISVGPGGAPTTSLSVIGGHVEVSSFTILPGASLRVSGPHPFRLTTAGNVTIRGQLILDGFDAKDVATLNTGSRPEIGAPGGPSGGKGGDSSTVTNNSTPRGSAGEGPGLDGLGASGGESGYAAFNLGVNARRPGGGAGGRFARDQGTLFAQNGFQGSFRSTGAISGLPRAIGGRPNQGPFVDGDETNDFFGRKAVIDQNGVPIGVIQGELAELMAGYGGGGGGDALPATTFPTPNWNVASDEKGGAGGGGGGAAEIRALGRIVFGAGGVISADGGEGGLGENFIFLDRVGGSGGSGSGGHVLLESPHQIDFTDGDPANALVSPHLTALGGPTVRGAPTNGNGMPIPINISHGGKGGPGVLQLHVPAIGMTIGDRMDDTIVIPTAALGSVDLFSVLVQPTPEVLLPHHRSNRSMVSRWLAPGPASLVMLQLLRASRHVRFQVAADDGRGRPEESELLIDWTANPRDLRALAGSGPVWIRYRMDFASGRARR